MFFNFIFQKQFFKEFAKCHTDNSFEDALKNVCDILNNKSMRLKIQFYINENRRDSIEKICKNRENKCDESEVS